MKKLFISYLLILTLLFMICTGSMVCLYHTFPIRYKEIVVKYYDDWRFVLSIIKTESDFNENAVSSRGACGLMQLLPSTARFIAEKHSIESYDIMEAEDNIHLGCSYFKYLQEKFVNKETALAAYNAGEGTVSRWLKDECYSDDGITLTVIPYKETKNYVEKILKNYIIYTKFYLTK